MSEKPPRKRRRPPAPEAPPTQGTEQAQPRSASPAITYRDAGVNIDAKHAIPALIRGHVRRTYGPRVVDLPGGFAGMFRLDSDQLFDRNYRKPTLVACCDGVGTKLLVARWAGRFDTIGIDLVAMNVNDLLCIGAEPLFFLDYIALNRMDHALIEQIIRGISRGCMQAGCALLGGETADMPDVYTQPGEFDLAGFAVGVVQKDRAVTGAGIQRGDCVLGLASSGIHSNGYSLVRRIMLDKLGHSPSDRPAGIGPRGASVADVLLEPTRIYVNIVRDILRRYTVKRVVRAMAHITGGGLPGNVNRVLPRGLDARIVKGSWQVPPIFTYLAEKGPVGEDEMYRVFNMGIGFVLIVSRASAPAILRHARRSGLEAWEIGEITRGSGQVQLV